MNETEIPTSTKNSKMKRTVLKLGAYTSALYVATNNPFLIAIAACSYILYIELDDEDKVNVNNIFDGLFDYFSGVTRDFYYSTFVNETPEADKELEETFTAINNNLESIAETQVETAELNKELYPLIDPLTGEVDKTPNLLKNIVNLHREDDLAESTNSNKDNIEE